jgi:hypothetical protein
MSYWGEKQLLHECDELRAENARLRAALREAKSQLTQYWNGCTSDRVEDAEAVIDAALAQSPEKP